jgi:hypothetical protein
MRIPALTIAAVLLLGSCGCTSLGPQRAAYTATGRGQDPVGTPTLTREGSEGETPAAASDGTSFWHRADLQAAKWRDDLVSLKVRVRETTDGVLNSHFMLATGNAIGVAGYVVQFLPFLLPKSG